MSYRDRLKDPRWQRRRLEILQRSNFTCEECEAADKTLHVHHKRYRHGAMPWEYDDFDLEALCEDCHEAKHILKDHLATAVSQLHIGDLRLVLRLAERLLPLEQSPYSIEAEQAVLGGLMLDNSTRDVICGRIRAEDFYRLDHQLIFAAIAELSGRGEPCDAVTLSEALDSAGHAHETGGLIYLAGIVRNTPTAANIRAHAEIVRERAVLRTDQKAGVSART